MKEEALLIRIKSILLEKLLFHTLRKRLFLLNQLIVRIVSLKKTCNFSKELTNNLLKVDMDNNMDMDHNLMDMNPLLKTTTTMAMVLLHKTETIITAINQILAIMITSSKNNRTNKEDTDMVMEMEMPTQEFQELVMETKKILQ